MGIVCLGILAAILAEWPALVAWGTVAAAPPGSAGAPRRLPGALGGDGARPILRVQGLSLEPDGPRALPGAPLAAVGVGLGRLRTRPGRRRGRGAARPGDRRAASPAGRWRPRCSSRFSASSGRSAWRVPCRRKASRSRSRCCSPTSPKRCARRSGDAPGPTPSLIAQARAAAETGPDLIAIPESSLPATWQGSERIRRDLSSIAALGPLVLFNDLDEEADDRYYNAARLLDARRPGGAAVPQGPPRSVRRVRPPAEALLLRAPRFDGHRRIHAGAGADARPVAGRSSSGSASATRSSTPGSPPRGRATAPTCSRPSRTTPGTAAPERRSSTSRARRCARSRTIAISSARRSPGSPASSDPRGRILAESRPDEKATVTGTVRRVSSTDGLDPVGLLDPAGRDSRRTGRANLRPRATREGAPPDACIPSRGPCEPQPMTERDDLLSVPDDRLGAPRRASGLSLIRTPRGARSQG